MEDQWNRLALASDAATFSFLTIDTMHNHDIFREPSLEKPQGRNGAKNTTLLSENIEKAEVTAIWRKQLAEENSCGSECSPPASWPQMPGASKPDDVEIRRE